MEKNENKLSDGFKVATIVLALFLAGSLFYIYKISEDATKTEKRLVSEKDEIRAELEARQSELEAAISQNSSMSNELIEQKKYVEQLLADLDKANGDVESLKRFKVEASNLKKSNQKLLAQNEVLAKENTKLTSEVEATKTSLTSAQKLNDTLSMQLTTTVEKASKLVVMNTKAVSYKVKGNGKEVPTDKGSRTDRITICYNVPQNNIAKKQEKTYLIQVIDAKNNVLGKKTTKNFGDKSLTYSLESTFVYENKTITKCESIDTKNGFPAGTYAVNIFEEDQLVSSSSITLR